MSVRARVHDWVEDHPGIYLARARMWILVVPVFIALGWQDSVFVVFLYSTWANYASDMGIYRAARAEAVARS